MNGALLSMFYLIIEDLCSTSTCWTNERHIQRILRK